MSPEILIVLSGSIIVLPDITMHPPEGFCFLLNWSSSLQKAAFTSQTFFFFLRLALPLPRRLGWPPLIFSLKALELLPGALHFLLKLNLLLIGFLSLQLLDELLLARGAVGRAGHQLAMAALVHVLRGWAETQPGPPPLTLGPNRQGSDGCR